VTERVSDKSALVIGASSGIGRASAALLARNGARVMAAARRMDRLQALAGEAPGIEIVSCDATSRAECEAAVAAATTKFGRLDILVYATGSNVPERSLQKLTPETWDWMIQVNLSGAFYATHAALPSMRAAGGGQLIYISSISAHVPDVSGAAYQAAKRGLNALAYAVTVEEKQNGIRTSVICPGLVDTEILLKRPVRPAEEQLKLALQPEDVAEAVLFVASRPARASIPVMEIMPSRL
jgi:NADP-dependent 3-hydroxy acid dehydrogenase YdfG